MPAFLLVPRQAASLLLLALTISAGALPSLLRLCAEFSFVAADVLVNGATPQLLLMFMLVPPAHGGLSPKCPGWYYKRVSSVHAVMHTSQHASGAYVYYSPLTRAMSRRATRVERAAQFCMAAV